MREQEKIIQLLDVLLANELTAINQCLAHSEMCGPDIFAIL
jgi:bacterioferritin (cytochrome b1)